MKRGRGMQCPACEGIDTRELFAGWIWCYDCGDEIKAKGGPPVLQVCEGCQSAGLAVDPNSGLCPSCKTTGSRDSVKARTDKAIDDCLAIILQGEFTCNQAAWVACRVKSIVDDAEKKAAQDRPFDRNLERVILKRREMAKDFSEDSDLCHAHLMPIFAVRRAERIADARMDEQQ